MGFVADITWPALDRRRRFRLCCRLVDVDVPCSRAQPYRHGGYAPECAFRRLRPVPLCQKPDVHRCPNGGHEPWSCAWNMAAACGGKRCLRAVCTTYTDRREISDRALRQSVPRLHEARWTLFPKAASLDLTTLERPWTLFMAAARTSLPNSV